MLEVASSAGATYAVVGGMRNYNIDATADEIDGGSFDSGGWGNVLPGQKSATLTAQAVYLSSGNTTSANALFDWFSSDTVRNWRIRFSTATAVNPNISGDGRVKSYSVSADRNDIVLLDFSIGFAGALVATTSTG
jgi:predicted secreted protein